MSREEYAKREAVYAACRGMVARQTLVAVNAKAPRDGDDPVVLLGIQTGILIQISEQLSDMTALLTPGMAPPIAPSAFGLSGNGS